jgi:hypothetical protein
MQKAVDTAPCSKMLDAGFAQVSRKMVCAYLTHALPLFADDEYHNPEVTKESQILPPVTTAGTGCFLRLYQQEFNES